MLEKAGIPVTQSGVDTFTFATREDGSNDPLGKLKAAYRDAAIAFDFKLTMTELNKFSAGASIADKFNRGHRSGGASSGTLVMGAKLDQTRQNERMFVVSTNLDDLFEGPEAPNCRVPASPANPFYPVTGSIGIKEVILTFVELAEASVLRGKDGAGNSRRLVDTLQFTTDTSAGVDSGKLTIAPVGLVLNLSEVSVAGSAGRKDVHQVGIALSLAVVQAAQVVPGPKAHKRARQTEPNPKKQEARQNAVDGFVERDYRRLQDALTVIQRRLE